MMGQVAVSNVVPLGCAADIDATDVIVSAQELINEIRDGRMVVVIDDENRENEGDLVIAAEYATPQAVNFMITHGRGLVCLTLDKARAEQLELPMMSAKNGTPLQTAFTVSIEAREGITTGISAFERAHTIATAINPENNASSISSPGHIFPLIAREGGVLTRDGHTEASVDLARLADLNPSGVICEILNEDGTMARLPDLIRFARKHGLKIGTIADLITYRKNRLSENMACLEQTA